MLKYCYACAFNTALKINNIIILTQTKFMNPILPIQDVSLEDQSGKTLFKSLLIMFHFNTSSNLYCEKFENEGLGSIYYFEYI